MKSEYDAMKNDYGTIKNELATLRKTYTTKSDEWIKEKLHQQQRMRDLEESLCSSAGEGWESERDRFKNIIEDRDSQITQLKIEGIRFSGIQKTMLHPFNSETYIIQYCALLLI